MAGYGRKDPAVTKTIGKLVGLLLTFYVFGEILDVVQTLLWTCPAYAPSINLSTVDDATAYCFNTTHSTQNATMEATGSSWFAGAVSFIAALTPIVAILGAMDVIWTGLKASNMI